MTLIKDSAHLDYISDGSKLLGKVNRSKPSLNLAEFASFGLNYKLVVVYFIETDLRLSSQINHERVLV